MTDIDITDDHTIKEIADRFSERFPFLKLVFFSAPVTSFASREEEMIKDESKTVREVRHRHTIGHVSINGHMKAETLHQLFLELYGLNVKVFRMSGNKWTGDIDPGLSLSELNREGEQMSALRGGR